MACDDPKPATTISDTDTTEESDSTQNALPPELQKGKEKEQSDSTPEPDTTEQDAGENHPAPDDAQPWQAIFAPQYNAYYFYNNLTGETTWSNPLQPSDPIAQSPPPANTSTSTDSALAQGIDPSLAHLDPSLVIATSSADAGPIPSFQAKFNARTGAFTRPDARTPGHLSEYERMKRMSEFYFDVNAWEQQVAEDHVQEAEGNGKKRKRPTKKDLERFKEQKRQKKIAKTAWLRT